MAITMVQSNGASSTTNNPTLTLNRVGAGNMLIAVCLQHANAVPAIATDSRSDVFDPIGSATLITGLGFQMWRVRNTIGGNTIITFPTVAASAIAAMEISGVIADSNVGLPTEVSQPNDVEGYLATGTSFSTTVTPGTVNDVLYAFCASLSNPVFTPPTRWTDLRTVTSASASIDLATLVPGSTAPVTMAWTINPSNSATIFAIALTPV